VCVRELEVRTIQRWSKALDVVPFSFGQFFNPWDELKKYQDDMVFENTNLILFMEGLVDKLHF
jgi:hypothetical protein